MSRVLLTWDRLPLYASDENIGEAVLGSDRKHEFSGLAQLLERDGMPKIDPLTGCRYVPAVKSFFDAQHGLSAAVPLIPNGVEGSLHGNRKRTPERLGSEVAKETNWPSSPVLVRRSKGD